MKREQLARGNELLEYMTDLEEKIKASENALIFPYDASVSINFNGYVPFKLDIDMKIHVLKIFKDYCEKQLEVSKTEFENL